MAKIVITPNPAKPGETVAIDATGLDPKQKATFETVDPNGVVSGYDVNTGLPTNINRPDPAGVMHFGINVPPVAGTAKVRVLQGGTIVATTSVVLQTTPTPTPPATPTGVTATPGDRRVTVNWKTT